MRACFCVCYCYVSNTGDGKGGYDRSVCVKQPTMAMVCVCAETDVACDKERGKHFSQFLNGKDNGPGGIVSWRAFVVLHGGVRR
jgi:hypothetical protein